jgi:hypothetical protein
MAIALVPALLFFDPVTEDDGKEKAKAKPDARPKKEKRLFCATCRHPVTHQDERISVQGGHEHRFTNPHGIAYHIGCFREAAGCAVAGEATTEFTWFSGYAWRIATCAHCQMHLGWCFQSGADYFHGLIVDRLISTGPAKNG